MPLGVRLLLVAVAALLSRSVAKADAALPAPSPAIDFRGDLIDPASARVVGKGRAASCGFDDGPFARRRREGGGDFVKGPSGSALAVTEVTAHHLVAITPPESSSAAMVFDRAGHELAESDAPGMVVEDATGRFAGYLFLDMMRGRLRLFDEKQRRVWDRPFAGAERRPNTGAAVTVGDVVLVALYSRIASGSSLLAYDRASGAPRWVADVEQLGVPHSQYLNDVTLEVRGGRAILRGYEMGGCYLQIFDVSTGRRLLSRR
jgi:hypothetical protein